MPGTTTTTHYALGRIRKIVVDWVGDAANGTVPDTVLPAFDGRIAELTTNPGAVAPTDDYDITLVDGDGVDRLQSLGLNRDTANTESLPIVYAGSTVHPPAGAWDALTLKIGGQAVHSATGRIVLIYVPA